MCRIQSGLRSFLGFNYFSDFFISKLKFVKQNFCLMTCWVRQYETSVKVHATICIQRNPQETKFAKKCRFIDRKFFTN